MKCSFYRGLSGPQLYLSLHLNPHLTMTVTRLLKFKADLSPLETKLLKFKAAPLLLQPTLPTLNPTIMVVIGRFSPDLSPFAHFPPLDRARFSAYFPFRSLASLTDCLLSFFTHCFVVLPFTIFFFLWGECRTCVSQ